MAIVVDITEFKRIERNGSVISAVFDTVKVGLMSGIRHPGQEQKMSVGEIDHAIKRDTYTGHGSHYIRQAAEAMGLYV